VSPFLWGNDASRIYWDTGCANTMSLSRNHCEPSPAVAEPRDAATVTRMSAMAFTGGSRLSVLRSRRLPGWLFLVAILAVAFMPDWVLAQGVAPTDNPVLSLAVAPNAPNEVLAGTLNSPRPAGVYRTADGGVTWNNTT